MQHNSLHTTLHKLSVIVLCLMLCCGMNFAGYRENTLTPYVWSAVTVLFVTYLLIRHSVQSSPSLWSPISLLYLCLAYGLLSCVHIRPPGTELFYYKYFVLYLSATAWVYGVWTLLSRHPGLTVSWSQALGYMALIPAVEYGYYLLSGDATGYDSQGLLMTRHYLALYLIVSGAIFLQYRSMPGRTDYLLLGILLAVVLLSGSRAAYVALVVALSCGYICRLRSKSDRRLYLVAATLAVVSLTILLYFVRPQSANGRFILWEIALSATSGSGLTTGRGAGYIEYHLPLLQSRYFAVQDVDTGLYGGQLKTVLNEYLTVWVEYGLPGTGLLLGLLLVLLRTLYRRRQYTLLAAAMACAAFALLSNPFYSLPLQTLMATLVVLASVHTAPTGTRIRSSRYMAYRYTILCLALVYTALHGMYIYRVVLWQELKSVPVDRTGSGHIEAYHRLAPWLRGNGYFLEDYALRLQNLALYTAADSCLDKALSLQSTLTGYLAKGYNLEQLKQYSEAEGYYRTAIMMQPKLFYPKFLLFDMYRSAGWEGKARNWGKAVLAFPVKIHHPDVTEIKDEIKNYLNKNK